MDTTTNNNDMLNGLINVLVNSITEKVTKQLEASIEGIIDKKIKELDFEEIIGSVIDEGSIADNVLSSLDLGDEIRTEIDSAIADHDFTDAITEALDTVKLTVKIDRN